MNYSLNNSGCIVNGRFVINGRIKYGGCLCYSDGKIEGIAAKPPKNYPIINAEDGYVLPGFIDIHLHGGGGYDFMDASAEAFAEISRIHCLHGITSIAPTTTACTPEKLSEVFEAYRKATRCLKYADFLGLHLEGPFISPEMKGAQNINCICKPTKEIIESIAEKGGDIIVRLSGAPELPFMLETAQMLAPYGITMSTAHSSATCEQIIKAYDYGYRHITHLYCSTTSVRKINQTVHAGITEAYYLIDGMTAELIGDGRHIPSELLRMVHKIKGPEKIALITDAMRAAGTDCTESFLGEKKPENRVIIEDGVAKLPDRSSFSGSIATADTVFKNAVLSAGLPIPDVSRMMSLTPAEIINKENQKGSLTPGKDADIVIIDAEFNIKNVFVRGNKKV